MESNPFQSPATPEDFGQVEFERPTNKRWVIFFLACGTSWFLYLHRYTWNFIEPKLTDEYGLSKTETGFLGSLFNWSYGGCQIPSGMIVNWFGPHLFLGLIIALWSVGLAMQGMYSNIWYLRGVRIFFGTCQAGCYPALLHVTHTWFPKSSRTSIQGWVAAFFGRGGGFMSSILMGSVLMGFFALSWQSSLFILAGCGLVFALIFLLMFRNSPVHDPGVNKAELAIITEGESDKSQAATKKMLPWRKAFKHWGMRFFFFQQIFNAGADNIFSLFMGSFFLTVMNVDIKQGGLLIGLPLLGGALGGIFGGFLNDLLIQRLGSRRWARTSIGFTGNFMGCVLMFVAISQKEPLAAGLALFVVKFFSDWTQPTVWGTCTDLGREYSATVFSIINTAGTIGGIIFPPLFGVILDRFATKEIRGGAEVIIPNFYQLFVFIAAMYMVSAVCWFAINCEKPIESVASERGEKVSS